MIAVIAGSRREFDTWIRPWVHVDDHKKFVCITNVDHARSLKITEVICIGTYYKLRDLEDIEHYLKYSMERNK